MCVFLGKILHLTRAYKMKNKLYDIITQGKSNAKKAFAVLIDPDKINEQSLTQTIDIAVKSKVDYFFVGGSLVVTDTLDTVVASIKKQCNIPVILFPGSPDQITPKADALLYLSLISGRNAELLIGQHVISAPFVKKSGLEIISVGYMLIDGGTPTTVSYISNSNPIPSNKNDIALCTAMAGEMQIDEIAGLHLGGQIGKSAADTGQRGRARTFDTIGQHGARQIAGDQRQPAITPAAVKSWRSTASLSAASSSSLTQAHLGRPAWKNSKSRAVSTPAHSTMAPAASGSAVASSRGRWMTPSMTASTRWSTCSTRRAARSGVTSAT